jgi:hypothetical protein
MITRAKLIDTPRVFRKPAMQGPSKRYLEINSLLVKEKYFFEVGWRHVHQRRSRMLLVSAMGVRMMYLMKHHGSRPEDALGDHFLRVRLESG